jgi:hypothetical protein
VLTTSVNYSTGRSNTNSARKGEALGRTADPGDRPVMLEPYAFSSLLMAAVVIHGRESLGFLIGHKDRQFIEGRRRTASPCTPYTQRRAPTEEGRRSGPATQPPEKGSRTLGPKYWLGLRNQDVLPPRFWPGIYPQGILAPSLPMTTSVALAASLTS